MSIVSPRESDIGIAEGAGIAGVKEARSAYGFGAANCEIQCRREDTPLGGLPGDWRYVELAELAAFRTGPFGSALHKSDYVSGGVPLINPMHIQDGVLVPDDSTSVTEDAADKLAVFRMRAGEIVMGRRGDMGRCAVIQPEQSGWLCGTGSLVIRCGQLAEPAFLQRILASDQVIRAIEDSSVGTTMINLNQAALSKIRVPLPGISEQRAIAEALSDVDGLLGALDALIAKKRAIKQAAMQQLLTGKTRLSGFSGDWTPGFVSDVVSSLIAGVSVNSIDAPTADGVPSVLKTSALTGGVFLPDEAKVIQPRDISRARTNPVRDTILISRMNTPNLVGEIAYVDRDYDWLFLPDRIWMARFIARSKLNVRWLAYVLSSPVYRDLLREVATGTSGSMKNISKAALLATPVEFPSQEEQSEIAEALSDIDAEIAALERRREKTRAIKQGMMQQLLTGRVRLIQPRGAADA